MAILRLDGKPRSESLASGNGEKLIDDWRKGLATFRTKGSPVTKSLEFKYRLTLVPIPLMQFDRAISFRCEEDALTVVITLYDVEKKGVLMTFESGPARAGDDVALAGSGVIKITSA